MEVSIRLYSQELSPSGIRDPFTLSVDESIWRLRYAEDNTEGRFILRIVDTEGGREWIAPAGDVIYSRMQESTPPDDAHRIYMPLWMLDAAGFEGNGETQKAILLTNEAFPEATKIVLRVIDSAFYTADLKAELEASLTKLGILRKHSTIQIPIQSLGGFPVEVFISDLEPADCVLCEGEEVVVEFEEPVDQVEPPAPRPPTPIPAPLLPLLPEQPPTQGFVAFQGEGRQLGGSPADAPEWRKGLRPRRP